jgi:predicted CXXCH cytochrome family protein
MLRKLMLLGACFAFVLAGAVSAQAAGIALTAHDQNFDGGACAACHLPHGAKGARLWPAAPVANAQFVGAVAPLCGYCHIAGGGVPSGFISSADPLSDTFVFGSLSHGYLMSKLTASAQPRQMTWSELPYHKSAGGGNIGRIECTTCHDVHNNDNKPFLRVSINIICAACHGDRQRTAAGWQEGNVGAIGAFAAWTKPTNIGVNNPGSHPVGTDITGDGNADAPITIWRSMKVGFSGTRAQWTTGGHLSGGNTGGITCVTCHAVHGLDYDADGNAANAFYADKTQPVANMLVLNQGQWTDGNGRTVANGAGGYNGLCEGCHVGNNTQMVAAYSVNANGSTFAVATGPINPNPGATPYSHPVDGMKVTAGRDWVSGVTWPTSSINWPIGSSTATSASVPNVICESCHVPHAAANTGRSDLNVRPAMGLTTDYMLRTTADELCWACHVSSIKRHHPVNKRYNTVGITYLIATGATARMDTLTCGTCHAGRGAHNWAGKGQVDLDPNWRPTNNGRGTQANELFDTVASLSCMDCHTGMMGVVKGNKSPTLHATATTAYSGTIAGPEAYMTIGYGSHVLGRIGGGGVGTPVRNNQAVASYWNTLKAKIGNLFDPAHPGWNFANYGGVGGWSRFGGSATSPVLVCESCHELQPSRNSSTHLLLGKYVEEMPPIAETRSRFCEACHNPAGTHQMTGQQVGQDKHVLTTNVGESWLATPTDTVNVKLSNNNMLNCDTCHQPHDAATFSRTFIIDVENASISAITPNSFVANAGVMGSYNGYWPSVQVGKGNYHTRFCAQCHPYYR